MAKSIETRTKELAKKMLALFGRNGQNWVRGSLAKDKDGYHARPRSVAAVKWCLEGALDKLTVSESVRAGFRNATKENESGTLATFNDSHRTYTHVRKLLQRVAAGE